MLLQVFILIIRNYKLNVSFYCIFINVSTKKTNKDVRVNVRLTHNERELFHSICKEKKTSISKEIRKYINKKIKDNEK